MTVRTTTALEVHYDSFKASMSAAKLRANAASTFMSSNETPSNRLLDFYRSMGRMRAEINAFAALVGIVDYVKTAEDDPLYDIGVECTALVAAIQACIDWIDTNFPSSGSYILETTISDGSISYRTFTIAQTAPLVTLIDAVSALIE